MTAPWTFFRRRYPPVTIDNFHDLEPQTQASLSRGDQPAMTIGKVQEVLETTDDWAIFIDADFQFRYVTRDPLRWGNDEAFHAQWNRIGRLQLMIAQLRSTHSLTQLYTLRAMLGHAISRGLAGDLDNMEMMLTRLERLIHGKIARNSRRVYVYTTIAMASVVVIVSATLVIGANLPEAPLMVVPHVIVWGKVITIGLLGGALGTLLSVLSAGKRATTVDPISAASEASFEARVRMAIGTLSGVVLAISAKTGVVSSSLLQVDPPEAAMMLLAIIGGFAERLVPSLLDSKRAEIETKIRGASDPPPKPLPKPSPTPGSEPGSSDEPTQVEPDSSAEPAQAEPAADPEPARAATLEAT